MFKYVGILFRLARLGLLHRYIAMKLLYGERVARDWLLHNHYEYRLHKLLSRLDREYESMLLIDIGCLPLEKLGYGTYYIGVDINLDEKLVCRGDTCRINPLKLDMTCKEDIDILEEAINEAGSHRLVVATVDIEGNLNSYLLNMLLKYVNLLIAEIHPNTQEENLIDETWHLLDNFPDKTRHYIKIKKD